MSQFDAQPPAFYGINDPPGTAPEGDPTKTPSAVIWFKAYAALMAMGHVAVFGLGVFMMIAPTFDSSKASDILPAAVMGGLYATAALLFGVPFVLSLVLRPKKWVHTLHMVLIAIGFLSCWCWPFSIPLIIAYSKPEVKGWFETG
ncbi:MAG TPA: hypothetical protein PLI95_04965 [Polyangiaceae bacterium]|nr:hypothetical protein [Polyangiaceae bacterium]